MTKFYVVLNLLSGVVLSSWAFAQPGDQLLVCFVAGCLLGSALVAIVLGDLKW